jgi:deoxyadenosine/deoxycytidine kinase
MKITIDGNIGCGKSTLLERIGRECGVLTFAEPVARWEELLKRFYRDPARWSLALNTQVLLSFDAIRDDGSSRNIVVERSPRSCKQVFVDASPMDDIEKSLFRDIYRVCGWEPEVSIYVRTVPSVCFERMTARDRACEKGVHLDYLSELHERYEAMYSEAAAASCEGTVYVVDGTADQDAVFAEVVRILESVQRRNLAEPAGWWFKGRKGGFRGTV